MKIKPKGRKIYRKKTAAEKMRNFGANTASLLGTLLVAGILVLVGYSAGKPLFQFLNEGRIFALPTEVEETQASTEATTEIPDRNLENIVRFIVSPGVMPEYRILFLRQLRHRKAELFDRLKALPSFRRLAAELVALRVSLYTS